MAGGGASVSSGSIYTGSSGGGLSGIFLGTVAGFDVATQADALLIAGGGGGAGGGAAAEDGHGSGGAGGGLTGFDGFDGFTPGKRGEGATTLTAGAGGPAPSPGNDGIALRGGDGGAGDSNGTGGGGGGGYFGGGGGSGQSGGSIDDAGAGGGSGFLDATVTDGLILAGNNGIIGYMNTTTANTADPHFEAGVGAGSHAKNGGNGRIVIQWFQVTGVEVDLGPDLALCAPASIILDPGVPGADYTWSDGSITETVTVNSSGTYWVAVSEDGCTGYDTVAIVIDDPIANFSAVNTEGCGIDAVDFIDLTSAPEGISTWLWDFGDGAVAFTQNPSHDYALNGTYTVTLTVTTANGCVSTVTNVITVAIYDALIAEFIYSPVPPEIGEPVLFENLSVNATDWYWTFGDGGTSIEENPSHTYSAEGTYVVNLEASNEFCEDEYQLTIVFNKEIIYYVPNAFTPDGDDFNQIFSPVFTDGFDPYDYHLTIFNRWGEIVFESYNTAVGWDGTYGDRALVIDGVYVWEIEFGDLNTDEKYKEVGHVLLLK